MQRENRNVWISQMQLRTSVMTRASEQLLTRANVKKKCRKLTSKAMKKKEPSFFICLLAPQHQT